MASAEDGSPHGIGRAQRHDTQAGVRGAVHVARHRPRPDAGHGRRPRRQPDRCRGHPAGVQGRRYRGAPGRRSAPHARHRLGHADAGQRGGVGQRVRGRPTGSGEARRLLQLHARVRDVRERPALVPDRRGRLRRPRPAGGAAGDRRHAGPPRRAVRREQDLRRGARPVPRGGARHGRWWWCGWARWGGRTGPAATRAASSRG